MRKWIYRRFLTLGQKIRLIPMSDEMAWEVYYEMSHVPNIKDLLELKRQLAYISYAETDDKRYLGYVQCIEELIEAMQESYQRLEELRKKEPKDSSGYKSSV